jgi:glycosyltransferase involved in cell wall biosynthesis
MTAAPGNGKRLAIFTICSNNYMPFAHVLFASLRRHHPEAALFLCLADRMAETPGLYGEDCTVIAAEDLQVPDFPSFAFRYDIMEFNTALKPFMVLHLLDDRGFDAVIYFDPDIEVFAPLTGVVAALHGGASFVFTPHLCAPNEDRREPNDVAIMRAGAYNLGFLAVSRMEETTELLGWWARRLRYQCINAQAEGIFVDQKFMDLIPGFAAHAVISHDTTLNVAYWNLGQRRIGQTSEGWTVDGAPLTFFHFSGFDPRKPDRLSKHDPRFTGDLPPPLAALMAQYASRLEAAGYGSFPGAVYAYGQFASGTPIPPAVRTMFRDWHPYWGGGDPFADYEAFLDAPWPEAVQGAPGHTVTNLMRFLQGAVPALGGLDLAVEADAARLVRWFVCDAAGAFGLDPALIEPAAARLGETRPVPQARETTQETVVSVIAPLRSPGAAAKIGYLTFNALLATGLATELRDGSASDGLSPAAGAAPVQIICLPAERMAADLPRWAVRHTSALRILVPLWDGARFRKAALAALDLVQEIWAPSRFIQLALAGHTDRGVIHMPIAIEAVPVAIRPRSAFGLPEDRFLVLSTFDARPNPAQDPLSAIRAFRLAFPRRGQACLVLASDDGPITAEQRLALEAVIDGDLDIRLVDGGLSQGERLSLTADCNALLSLHGSPGLALPIARAMLLSRPVIASRYGASGEFVTTRTGYPVDCRLVPGADGPWAEADTGHAAWIMARLAADPEAAAPRIAAAEMQLRRNHGREAVAARQTARLRALGIPPA